MAYFEIGYLGTGDSLVRGVSQAYSHVVKAYYLKKTPPPSDRPVLENRPDFFRLESQMMGSSNMSVLHLT